MLVVAWRWPAPLVSPPVASAEAPHGPAGRQGTSITLPTPAYT